MAMATTVVSGLFMTPSTRAMAQAAHQPLYWILLPALLTLPLVAGGAVLIGLVNRRRHPGPDAAGSDRPSRPARAAGTDRVWRAALLVLLVGYAVLVLLAAWFPVLPSYQRSSMAPAPNPLADYYVTIAIATTAVLPTRGRFAYVVALAPPLLATYPPGDGGLAHIAVEEVALYLATSLGAMGILTWLLHQASTLDEADARRRALLIDLRTEQSRSKARRLSDNFIHDHILSVLKAVPTVPAASPRLRRGAREALASLRETPGSQAAARSASESSGASRAPLPRAMSTSSSRRTRRTGRSRAGAVTASLPWRHEAVPIPRWMGPVPWVAARCSDRAMIARARSRARPSAMGSRMRRLRRTGCSV